MEQVNLLHRKNLKKDKKIVQKHLTNSRLLFYNIDSENKQKGSENENRTRN